MRGAGFMDGFGGDGCVLRGAGFLRVEGFMVGRSAGRSLFLGLRFACVLLVYLDDRPPGNDPAGPCGPAGLSLASQSGCYIIPYLSPFLSTKSPQEETINLPLSSNWLSPLTCKTVVE